MECATHSVLGDSKLREEIHCHDRGRDLHYRVELLVAGVAGRAEVRDAVSRAGGYLCPSVGIWQELVHESAGASRELD